MTRKSMILTAAGLLAAGLVWSNRGERLGPDTALAKTARDTSLIAAAGRTEPSSEEVKIGPEVAGKLRRVMVDEGDRVRQGQVIAVLENEDYAARIALAEAALKERQAVLDRIVNGARAEERRESRALVREAEAVVENARAEVERRRSLLDRGAVSRMEFDQVEREHRVAAARLDAARERAAFINADAREDERRRAEAELDRARAQIAEARALLDKTLVKAPLNGVVLRRHHKTGESVSPSDRIVTLGDTSRLMVRVDVDETDVAKLAIGQTAWVRADAYGDRKFPGRVTRVGEMLGRKNLRTDEPSERVDKKILETLVLLDTGVRLPVGLRVDAYIQVQ
ncbi:MAG: efflux RND transporter periplasmic adaptor subunit [Bryobacteraceae bacterium]|nr:efflux RND transporter periplasmic adaptor subunit [Bryobacteraceae bacterium]